MENIKFVYLNNNLIISFNGEIDNYNVLKMKDKLTRLRRNYKPSSITYDFKGVNFIDSSGIGLILGRYNEYKIDNIKFSIVNVNRQVSRLLEIAGLNKIIKISLETSVV